LPAMRRLSGFLLFVMVACPRVNGDAAKPATSDAGGALPHAQMNVVAQDGRAFGLNVELALDDASRERGLMFRKELADDKGMLFVFPKASPHTFWMKNTLIPLDMIFAADDGRVMGCVARAEPMTLTGRTVDGPSKYVLEVAGGWCADHGIGAGAKLVLGDAAKFKPE